MNIDDVITKLQNGEIIRESTVVAVLDKMMELVSKESNVLCLRSPIIICGDIHGQFDDLLQLFKTVEDKPNHNFLFMGDYVDRGHHSMNTFLYLCCKKIKNPNQYYLLRGNHESRQVSRMYGFYNECVAYYGHDAIFSYCNDVFDLLPIAAVIDKQIFSVHGGLSPDIVYIDQISLLQRQDELPSEGPISDLLWSDPENISHFHPNTRGAGFLYGPNEVKKFNHNNKLDLITRSHQLASEGYQFYFPVNEERMKVTEGQVIKFKNSQDLPGSLVTVWSAPNYSYRTINQASVLVYDEKLGYEIRIFDSNPQRINPKYPQVSGSIYFM